MLRTVSVALALALASCSAKSAQPPTSTTGTDTPLPGTSTPGSNDGGTTSTSTCGFVTSSTSFALPAITDAPTVSFAALSNDVACATGTSKLDYTLADMNGDGRLDLLVTSACDDTTIGVSAWFVYLGSASGFAATATRYTLPPASPAGCATVALFDVDGNLLPDYVVTSLCNDATVGSSRWLVYPNGPTGFSTTATSYTLPPGFSAGAFATTGVAAATCASGANDPAFELFDIDGDGKLDFVVTQECTDATIGTTAWNVFAGSATGASQTSATFALPTNPPVTAGAFATTTGTLSCSNTVTKPQYGLIDFDADGKLDLLVTQGCNQAEVGTTAWLFFRNTGTGFAASTTIALPSIPSNPTNSFPSLAATGTCSNGAGTPTYVLLDGNGDALPDLLVTRDCADPLTGASYWQLFANDGSGFTSPYQAFTLPSVLGATPTALAGLSGTSECTTAPVRPTYTTTYLAGFTLDVVVTADCSDTTVGATQWLLFPASCK